MYRLYLSCLVVNFLLLFIISPVYSQEENGTGKITGVVRDSKGAPVQFATVVLLKQADSALVKGVMTDAQGAFQFEDLREGVYFVKISQLGFKTETTAPISVNGGSSGVSLPPVTLLTDAKNLKEVTVTGRKRLIELNADKLIFNVANTINTAGDNALQTVKKGAGRISFTGRQDLVEWRWRGTSNDKRQTVLSKQQRPGGCSQVNAGFQH